MRVYEVLFIVAPNIEESDVDNLVTQLSDVATNQGAQITKVDRMGRRRLAYPIGKFNEGYYVVFTLEGTGAEIAELERRIRMSGDLKRSEKFGARRAARAAASAGARRTRRREPALPVGEDVDEGDEEEELCAANQEIVVV